MVYQFLVNLRTDFKGVPLASGKSTRLLVHLLTIKNGFPGRVLAGCQPP